MPDLLAGRRFRLDGDVAAELRQPGTLDDMPAHEGHLLLDEWLIMARAMTAPSRPQLAPTDETVEAATAVPLLLLVPYAKRGGKFGDPEMAGWGVRSRRDPPW